MTETFAGRLIIEWPPASSALPSFGVRLIDADTNCPLDMVIKMLIADVQGDNLIRANLTRITGLHADGNHDVVEETWLVVECRTREREA